MKIAKKIIPAVIIIAVAAVAFFYFSKKDQASIPLQDKESLPLDNDRVPAKDFTFRDLEDKGHSLLDFQGRIIIVNFRTIQCGACDVEMDFLKTFVPSLDSNKVKFIALFLGDKQSVVKTYFNQKNAKFPAYCDDYGLSAIKYRVFGLPTSVIIDKNFKVVARITGAIDWNQKEVGEFLKALANE
ncbi:MAG: TlpA disulfide reductase family protein [Candidatus Omnitrophica bacterium]|nr:TlpA disulfide reductase family protein [Candidatus Omnitrophota bacterium]